MRKYLPTIIIFTIIIGIIALGIWYSDKDSPIKELAKLNIYSKEELSFLEEQGFLDNLDNVDTEKISNSQEVIKALKSPGLIEQNLNAPDESFEVLATKLTKDNYQLAFKLENRSKEKKEFYLIPVSKDNQAEFQEIKGVINNRNLLSINKDDVKKEPLESLYNIQQHKKELNPQLAKAYDDIDNNNYQAKPIKITLDANTTLLAKSEWIIKTLSSGVLQPVYFLIYGSAGGAKEELTILNVHSHPQQGENWEVSFTTKGKADLKIIPNDQATIDDDEFIGLFCDNEERFPQILQGDVIYYPDWKCNGTGKVVHYTLTAGNHTLRFEFGGQVAYAYNWFSANWAYRKKITIQTANVDSDLTDFPLYVYLDPSGAGSGLASKIKDDGYDIRFTQLDGDTEIPYERESYSEADGNSTGHFWVKTAVADGVGESATDIYMYYGYADATDGSDPANTWDANYLGVYHMAEASWDGTPVDDSAGTNDGTAAGAATTTATNAKIYRCGTFDGDGDYVDLNTIITDFTANHTITAWARSDDVSVWHQVLASSYNQQFTFGTDDLYWVSGASNNFAIANVLSIDTWYYVAVTYDGTNITLYYNNTSGSAARTPLAATADTLIGAYTATQEEWDGILDEVRITNDARTANEIKFEYYNMNEADNELAWGAEEAGNSAPTITSVSDYPDPEKVGNDVTFSVDWNDADAGELVKIHICKTNTLSGYACETNQVWCETGTASDDDPETCTYPTTSGDIGSNTYYAFVCDDEDSCSGYTSSTFTVEAVSTPSKIFKGGTHFK